MAAERRKKIQPLNVQVIRGIPDLDKNLRLQGDHLFHWAKLTSAVDHAVQTLNNFGAAAIREMGLPEGHYGIQPDGYLFRMSAEPAASTGSVHDHTGKPPENSVPPEPQAQHEGLPQSD